MIVKRKLYSSLEEKSFGEVKRANKAAKRAELIKKGLISSEDTKNIKSEIEGTAGNAKIRRMLDESKGKKRHPKVTKELLDDAARVRNARQQRDINERIIIAGSRGDSKEINFDSLRHNNTKSKNRRLLDRDIKVLSKIFDLSNEEPIKKQSEESLKIAREEAAKKLRTDRLAKAKELKAIKARKQKLAKNAKIGGGIAGGLAIVGTGAYLAKKHYDKKKDKED